MHLTFTEEKDVVILLKITLNTSKEMAERQARSLSMCDKMKNYGVECVEPKLELIGYVY